MLCNKITIPEFTKEQIAECHQCMHISGKKIWCCLFGAWVRERQGRIIQPSKQILTPSKKSRTPCCGKKVKKAKNILTGYVNFMRGKKHATTDEKIKLCQECEENTWMTKAEHAKWLLKHGIKVLENFDQLEKLPRLPKHKKSKKRKTLYCRLCKCHVEAKITDEDERCLLKKW